MKTMDSSLAGRVAVAFLALLTRGQRTLSMCQYPQCPILDSKI